MILAAGLGLRLRPLTYTLPKSMAPLSNKPLLEYIIKYIVQAGIKDIVINLHHLPKTIMNYFGNGASFGARINYSFEKEILGTAGGIKKIEPLLMDDLFFVINSDIAFKLNFRDVVQVHKKNNALITMVLRVDNDTDKYGSIEVDKTNKVRRFLNFPEFPQKLKLKRTMFTGISLFDPAVLKEFPEKGYCDISKEIYPKLLKKELPVFGYVTDEYWKDIGSPKQYLFLQKDIFSGKVFQKIVFDRQEFNSQNKFDRVKIIPPVAIGEKVIIHKNSTIGPNTSIGKNCIINEGCVLKNSILWDNIAMAKNSKINNSIVYDKESILTV